MAGLAALSFSLFIWTAGFGAQRCLPEVHCSPVSRWPPSSAGLPAVLLGKPQAAEDPQCGQAEVWVRAVSLGPPPILTFIKCHVEPGVGLHPAVSKGSPLLWLVQGPASLLGSPASAAGTEQVSGNKSLTHSCVTCRMPGTVLGSTGPQSRAEPGAASTPTQLPVSGGHGC